MHENQEGTRGYDDTAYLAEMADGVIRKRFTSVDEAARSVLGEDGGSNVDRLRRKYREQNWHDRGLYAYVEAEVARRAAEEGARDVELSLPSPDLASYRLGLVKTGLKFVVAFGAAVAVLSSIAAFSIREAVAWEDPREVARRARAVAFAESSF
ncbi:hypothetical protein G6L37_05215 [Agrobacterium rubi]|nr:hypothetical protein [Agrobacterium rubi]NTF24756.1 hypothetical protein [Agrobacterium rubi]